MIRCVTIKNFKCLRDVTVNLEPFTVFVGANGSGKTRLRELGLGAGREGALGRPPLMVEP